MKPSELTAFLNSLIEHDIQRSLMIWGPPGIGKSSIVKQVAASYNMDCIDLRLSQLAPTDLRGLPVAEAGLSHWYPPEFLPQSGQGILFLDELNLAPPAMQGMAQQLILDREVGSYAVPEGWFIWAAGNRKEDRAAVFDMPAPLANRFLHLEVEPDFDSFKQYALKTGINEQILSFLSFRPKLLHKMGAQQVAWPSPRTWEMASDLHEAQLDIAPAVGVGAGAEFAAYLAIYQDLPDLDTILEGRGNEVDFPEEPSIRYATTIGLTARAQTAEQAYHLLAWLVDNATVEWVQLCAIDLFPVMRAKGEWRALLRRIQADQTLADYIEAYQALLEEGTSA
jgi:MoxR-like ATPase